MRFWISYFFLLLLCVAAPFGASFYFDTQSQVERAGSSGANGARLAGTSLEAMASLEAHRAVAKSLTLAQRLSDEQMVADVGRPGPRRKTAFTGVAAIVTEATPKGGFVWLVDEEGRVLVESGQTDPPETFRSVVGHPLFVETQHGLALDGTWVDGAQVLTLSGAPITDRGVAKGAVLMAQPLERELVASWAKELDVELTLVQGTTVVVSTLGADAARELAMDENLGVEPVLGGSLASEMVHDGFIKALPLLIDKRATGLAYASVARPIPGSAGLRWVVSGRSGDGLGLIAARQELIIVAFAVSLLVALLIGMINYRTFVSPISRIEKHLSEIQLGSGHGELLETSVSGSYRRLVRLTNMLVQKMPARSFSSLATNDMSPISELPNAPMPRRDSLVQQVDSYGVDAVLGGNTGPIMNAPSSLAAFPSAPTGSLSGGNGAGLGDELFGDDTPGNDPIAQAIATMEKGVKPGAIAPASPPPPPPFSGKRSPRSASEIRGNMPSMSAPAAPVAPAPVEMSPFIPPESEFLRSSEAPGLITQEGPVPLMGGAGVRGGGSLDLGGRAGLGSAPAPEVEDGGFNPEATVVAPVAEDLLAKSARDDYAEFSASPEGKDMTLVATVPPDLLAASAGDSPMPGASIGGDLDAGDRAHFKEVYEKFVDMRRKCGEGTSDLAFEKFLTKLIKNREQLVKKYQCRTVRFQVYEKDGKAALKATPVRAK